MKRILPIAGIILVCTLIFSGCDLLDLIPKRFIAHEESSTIVASDVLENMTPSSQVSEPEESEMVVSQPLSAELPYLKSLPAETCVFREPDGDSAFSQTIGADGTFTIVEEKRHTNGQIWGRLKSGVGWVNLSDLFCHGAKLPAVTVSKTGKIVKKAAHHRVGEGDGEYVVYLTFMAHQTVYNLTLTEERPDGNRIIATMDTFSTEKPLVVGVLLTDTNSFALTYQKNNGAFGSARVDQNLGDGPDLEFGYQ